VRVSRRYSRNRLRKKLREAQVLIVMGLVISTEAKLSGIANQTCSPWRKA